ncbi:transglycosylase domain-containing protein [Brooklawnia cerclae]|uniref:Membrane peptidoglycan carboxypeptidase n=1 Tax=Brooklawnia cerclae TaxID=349934 RepID=A0ABX0SMY8_9ACTN|nr:transglycosylase domain-containing protein [Brooklawnia cerclae]NIH58131.1 membrane peptidoglycan carboxypeptidase [Brooklawnia cerclae]
MGETGSYGGPRRAARPTDANRSAPRRAAQSDATSSMPRGSYGDRDPYGDRGRDATTRASSGSRGSSGTQGNAQASRGTQASQGGKRRTTATGAGRSTDSTRNAASASTSRSAARGSSKGTSKGSKRGGRGGRKKRGLLRRILRVGLIVALVMALLGVGGAFVFYQRAELPDPNAEFLTQTTHLYFRDGTTELGSLAIQNRTEISYDEIPQVLKDAVVAAEDRTFWTNQGVDIKGMARAFWRIARGQDVQGGSTITQQYIKIRYLTSDQTVTRKLNEVALAVKMNKGASKEEVLGGYLNTIYFGRGAYGVQAAAQAYFGVDAKDLTVAQSVVLASVLNNPSMYDPANGDEERAALLERYNWVLDSMVDPMGTLTQADRDANYGQLPDFPDIQTDDVYGGTNGFLIRMAEDELEANGFTADQINGGGLTIVTTFDSRMQQAAVDSAQSNVAEAAASASPLRDENGDYVLDENGNTVQPDASDLHVGLASVEVGTGEVLALYGGEDFVSDSRNWATTPRYAASTFKVWGAVAGLRHGFGLSSLLQGNTYTPEGDLSSVQNDSGAQYGSVTLKKAIEDSINTAFVDLVSQVPNGESELIRAANDAGIPEDDSWAAQLNRLVLGEGEVTPLDNASGYATLANNGVRNVTHVVREVRDASGNVIYSGDTEGTQAIENTVARDLTSALQSAVASSTVNAVDGRDVAGKTGTEGVAAGQEDASGDSVSQSQVTRAAWLVGYTKQIATSVMMVAGDSGEENLDVYKKPGNSAFYGAGYPTSVWNDYMAVATEGMEDVSFDPAANIQPTVRSTLTASATPSASASSSEPQRTTQAPQTTTQAPTTYEPPETTAEETTSEPPPETTDPVTTAPTTTPTNGNGGGRGGGGQGEG